MALILSIDTAIDTANICLAKDGSIIGSEINSDQKSHGSFMQIAIKRLFATNQIDINTIDAVAVAYGPGSYTGLRVGLSSAKGLCYALNKPLITVNTLEILALAAIDKTKESVEKLSDYLFCPLIDARRMEVFTAIYNSALKTIQEPQALILDENSFQQELQANKIVFCGNGHQKLKQILNHPNAIFVDGIDNVSSLIKISDKLFSENRFSDLAYCEPFYVKEVFFAEKSKI